MKKIILLTLVTVINSAWAFELVPQKFLDIKAKQCVSDVSRITNFIDSYRFPDYRDALRNYDEDFLRDYAFQYKLDLRNKLSQMYDLKVLNRDCANAFREAYRAIRTFEDIIEEHQVRHNPSRVSHSSFTPKAKLIQRFLNLIFIKI